MCGSGLTLLASTAANRQTLQKAVVTGLKPVLPFSQDFGLPSLSLSPTIQT